MEKLPGASNALTFGILSIVLTVFCCGPFGAIFSIIGLSNAKKAENAFLENPHLYGGYENVKTGRVLSYIGLGLSIIFLLLTIAYFGVLIALFSQGDFSEL
ncbi:MAG: CCC motif membrane protein [Maribacter sp.]